MVSHVMDEARGNICTFSALLTNLCLWFHSALTAVWLDEPAEQPSSQVISTLSQMSQRKSPHQR